MSPVAGPRRQALGVALVLAVVGAGASPPPSQRELLDLVWRGVQQAQERHASGCGTLTEKRVSPLLVRPLVMHGTFCAAGVDRFRVEYAGPEPVRITYNRGVLNVSTGRRTEVLDVGNAVRRTQRYFAGPRATENLEHDFSISVAETSDGYALQLLPVSGRIAGRVKRVGVVLGKADFLPRRIEIEGRSGVDSTFEIQLNRLDAPVDERQFEVYRP